MAKWIVWIFLFLRPKWARQKCINAKHIHMIGNMIAFVMNANICIWHKMNSHFVLGRRSIRNFHKWSLWFTLLTVCSIHIFSISFLWANSIRRARARATNRIEKPKCNSNFIFGFFFTSFFTVIIVIAELAILFIGFFEIYLLCDVIYPPNMFTCAPSLFIFVLFFCEFCNRYLVYWIALMHPFGYIFSLFLRRKFIFIAFN